MIRGAVRWAAVWLSGNLALAAIGVSLTGAAPLLSVALIPFAFELETPKDQVRFRFTPTTARRPTGSAFGAGTPPVG